MHVHHVDRHSGFAAAKMAKNNLFESERMFATSIASSRGRPSASTSTPRPTRSTT